MAHHKRKRAKDRRAGCLLCKPHKSNGLKHMTSAQTRPELRSREDEKEAKLSGTLRITADPDTGEPIFVE